MKFFCTCGRGTEIFVALELYGAFKACAPKINITDGKVFFEITNPQEKLKDVLSLKSCERIFIDIAHSVDVKVFNNKQGMSAVGSALNGISSVEWTEGIEMLEYLRKMEHVTISGDKNDVDNNDGVCVDDDDDDDGPKRKRFCHRVTTFRVSAKCSGRPSKFLNQKWLSCTVGQHLTSKYSLTVDLRRADMEVFFHLNDNGLVIGIPCCSRPLSKRSYVKHNGLRSTVASVVTSMCAAKPGMTLLDPMCGRGILLLEAASMYKGVMVIGCDVDVSALEKADDNVSHYTSMKQGFVELMRCDARSVPLKSSSVDAVVCDIPFGLKHSLMQDMKSFLISIDRLLVPDGKCIILSGVKTTKQLLALVKESFACDDTAHVMSDVSSGDRENLWKHLQRILMCRGRTEELEDVENVIATSVDVTSHGDRLLGNEGGGDDDIGARGGGGDDDAGGGGGDDDIGAGGGGGDDDIGAVGGGGDDDIGAGGGGGDDDSHKSHPKSERNEDGQVNGRNGAGERSSRWRKELIHYLKLGETDSFLCVFTKLR